jgi:competence protein ComEC
MRGVILSNKKFIYLLICTIIIGLISPITGKAAGFNDVSNDYTFYDEVNYLSSKGFITGYDDGSFRASSTVTRAQAAILIGRALGFDGEARNTKFSDVTSAVTGSGYIASAVDKGIISGFPDGSYRPYEPVTRGQMAIFINRAYTLTTGQANSFKDVSTNMAAYQAILNVSVSGIASGYSDGTYRPDQHVNRGQFSAFLARTLEPSFRSLAPMIVKFLNVGQGDAIFIQYPNGTTALVDAGRSDTVIDSALKSENITHIDTFIATHPDADHIGGADFIIKNYGVTKVIDSGQVHTTQTYFDYLSAIDASNSKFVVAHVGDNVTDDTNVSAKVLFVDSDATDLNDGSIVLMLSYGLTDFLLTGDAGLEVEEYLLENYNLDAEILKVAHHGSNTSTSGDFLEAVNPEEAILSYGENSYGHPNDEVILDLITYDVNMYSTYQQGTITVNTVGNNYSINANPVQWGVYEPVPVPQPEPSPSPTPTTPVQTDFANCTELRVVYPDGVSSSHPAYQSKMDRDKDGWACER